MISELLTVEEAAKRLKLAPFTVRKMCREGRLRCVKLGQTYRIAESDLTVERLAEMAKQGTLTK